MKYFSEYISAKYGLTGYNAQVADDFRTVHGLSSCDNHSGRPELSNDDIKSIRFARADDADL
jgi:hypothetical protein